MEQRAGIQGIQVTQCAPKYTGGIQGVYSGLYRFGVYRVIQHLLHPWVYRCIQVKQTGIQVITRAYRPPVWGYTGHGVAISTIKFHMPPKGVKTQYTCSTRINAAHALLI